MYSFTVFMTVLVAVLASEEKYSDKYDKFDLDEVFHNERLLENYFKCLMDTGPCTPEGTYLKKSIPEALADECAKCTEIQKEQTEKTIKYLSTHEKEKWEELLKKYDPEGTYKKRYEELAHEHDIHV